MTDEVEQARGASGDGGGAALGHAAPAAESEPAQTADTSSNIRWRSLLAVATATVLIVLVGALAVRWWHDRSYVGSTVDLTLEWDCWNAIGWRDTSRGGDHGVYWLAERNATLTGTLPTSTDATTAPPTNRARGHLHFDSYSEATFTSDAGGTVVLTRQPDNRFYSLACGLEPAAR
jgi:hypothetical protein